MGQCAYQDLKQVIPQRYNKTHSLKCDDVEVLADLVTDGLSFMPKDTKVFSETGCKRVQNKVGIVLEIILEELEAVDQATLQEKTVWTEREESVAHLGRCRLISS